VRSLASIRRQREKLRAGPAAPAAQKVIRDVVVPETISVRDLALRMAEPAGAVVKALLEMGERAKAGYECGLALGSYQDLRVGDRLECYAVEEVARSLPAAA
jgi:hypothetical protein